MVVVAFGSTIINLRGYMHVPHACMTEILILSSTQSLQSQEKSMLPFL